MLDLRTNLPSRANDVADLVIAKAYRNLGFNRSAAETFGAWYVSKTPTGNVIEDETPGRKSRTELATTGSVFDGTNYFETLTAGSEVCGTDDTAFTVRVVFSGNGSSANGDYVCATHDDSPSEGWRIWLNSGFISFSLQDLAGVNRSVSSTLTEAQIQAGGIYEVVGVYDPDADTVSIYVNGEYHEENAAPSFDAATQGRFRIATKANATTGKWFGNVYEAQVWNDQALTAAEIVRLWGKEISYFQGAKAPSVAWLLDGPTCTDLIGDNDLTPVADPAAYVGSFGSTWLNDQGYGTTAYESDWSSGLDGWTVVNNSTIDVVDFEGETNVLRLTVGDEASERMELASDFLTDGESYTLKFDIYIPSSNTTVDSVRWTASAIGSGTLSPSDAWTSYTQTNQVADTANPMRLYAIAGGQVTGLTIGDVFYLANVEIIAEESVFPKRWNADLNSKGYAGDVNSFGPCKRNREYSNGPAIDLNGVDQYGVKPNSHDYSGEDWTLSGYCLTDAGGTRDILSQTSGTGQGRTIFGRYVTTNKWVTNVGGSAAEFSSISDIVLGREYFFELVHDYSASSMTLTVTDLTTSVTESETLTSLVMESANGDFNVGANRLATTFWDGKIWGLSLECTTDPTKSFNCPISEEVGIVSHNTLNPASPIAWQGDPTWDFTANDVFFHGETVGYSSVPIFVDPVELIANGNINMDGIKTASIEIDFLTRSKTNTFYCQGSVSPFRLSFTTAGFTFSYRDDTNAVVSSTIPMTYETGVVYRLKFDLVEHDTNPTTESYATVSDRITGEVYGTVTGLNFAASTASSNSGPAQIGSYANATSSVDADIYRVRSVIGGVKELLWTSDNYLVNQANDSAMNESGGTLSVKKIPAVSKALDANGYPTTNPAGPYHNRTAAEVTETPVANSDSVNPIYFAAEFDGTTARENLGNQKLVDGFDLEFSFYMSSGGSEPVIDSTNNNSATNPGLGITKDSSENISFVVRGASGAISYDTTSAIYNSRWTKIRVNRSGDTISFFIDDVLVQSGSVSTIGYAATESTNMFLMGHIFSSYSPGYVKNLKLSTGSTVLIDRPYYKDNLDRSLNTDHGDGTGITFLSNAMETDLNPEFAETETRAVTSGDRKIISLGAR